MNITEQQTKAIAALARKYGQPPTRQGRDGKDLILHINRPGELSSRMFRITRDGVTTEL
jgi:hypothetical protein